jgi:hypothetical protein
MALVLGLKISMHSAVARPELKVRLKELVKNLGPYPHSKLSLSSKVVDSRPPPCAKFSECGFSVPMLKAFIHFEPSVDLKEKI